VHGARIYINGAAGKDPRRLYNALKGRKKNNKLLAYK